MKILGSLFIIGFIIVGAFALNEKVQASEWSFGQKYTKNISALRSH